MGENSKIEWCDHTFNAWWGCEKVSEACKHCYAETLDNRTGGGHWGPGSDRKMLSDAYWAQLKKWNDKAIQDGTYPRIFVNSMSDLFEDHPQVTMARRQLFLRVELFNHLDYIFLTKRPENVMRLIPDRWQKALPKNVLMGVTVENQAAAALRIPILLKIPATIRFLSCEPLLEIIDLRLLKLGFRNIDALTGDETEAYDGQVVGSPGMHRKIDWVICGGESGPKARPMPPAIPRLLRNQCRNAGTLFFFKQWGEWIPAEERTPVPLSGKYETQELGSFRMLKVGKKLAGRYLDGECWDEIPEPGFNYGKLIGI